MSGNEFAAEIGEDDGFDPRRFGDRRGLHTSGRDGPGRKALQLAAQAREAVSVALAGGADAVLRELTVVSVRPAPHSGRLMVTVAVPADVTDRPAVETRLRHATGWLRASVATAVNRRRAPELVFEVV